jgi:hypothetical protein
MEAGKKKKGKEGRKEGIPVGFPDMLVINTFLAW